MNMDKMLKVRVFVFFLSKCLIYSKFYNWVAILFSLYFSHHWLSLNKPTNLWQFDRLNISDLTWISYIISEVEYFFSSCLATSILFVNCQFMNFDYFSIIVFRFFYYGVINVPYAVKILVLCIVTIFYSFSFIFCSLNFYVV